MSPTPFLAAPVPPTTQPLAGHVYVVPVVREQPLPPADPPGDRSW